MLSDILDYIGADSDFSAQILMIINAVCAELVSLGVIETTIVDGNTVWSDFNLGPDKLSLLKLYVSIKTRLEFDPPANANILKALQDSHILYQFRLMEE